MATASPAKTTVAIAQPIDSAARDFLAETYKVVEGDGWKDALEDISALIVRNAPLNASTIQRAPNLKIIARVGVGTDSIDLNAATERGIAVAITPDANSVAVAEHTMALILALQRNVVAGNTMVRTGQFNKRDQLLGRTLAGRTLGIVGYGRIGKRVAHLAQAFDLQVIVFDPWATETEQMNVRFAATLQELLELADIITLHAPLTDATSGLINNSAIEHMKAGAYLVNTARAPLVDNDALAAALSSGHIAGAAVDVYDGPPGKDHVLYGTSAVLTPHVSALTQEAFAAMSMDAAKAVSNRLSGRPVRWVINQVRTHGATS